MTQTISGGPEALRASVTGDVFCPGDPGYDEARRVWNAQIDRHPAVVVMCADAADVAAAVVFARCAGLEISVRGGGHNTSGAAVNDGGLMINLSRMDQVSVDVPARRARAGGGALLSALDAATQQHGLATPSGTVSHTGVGGLTLGGGQGWLTRRHGLSVDNLTGAEVVLADGSVVWADECSHPDLFWALRGGGGNFGVVTTFEFALHEVGPIVHLGFLFWALDQGVEAFRAIREIVADLPPEFAVMIVAADAPPAPFVPPEHVGKPGVALVLVGLGEADGHAAQVDRVRAALPTLFDAVTPLPYTVLQQMIDQGTAWGQQAYEKGTDLPELCDGAIDVLVEHLSTKPGPGCQVLFYRLDGAYSTVAEDATAYGGTRAPRYAPTIVSLAPDAAGWAPGRDWVRGLWTALQPYALGIGSYVNTMSEFEEDRIRASYGEAKYRRLAGVKAHYDPDNTFRGNANIPPA